MKCNEQIEVCYADVKLVQICMCLYAFRLRLGIWQLSSVAILVKPYTKEELEGLVKQWD